MWLTSSSIGRKFVMALTGACLVLFVTFHVVMNAVCIVWPTAYNQVCMFLGANWYALIASVGLAALFIIHIIYAIWLTIQNRNARGNDRYAVTSRPPQVEWSSKNMLVLGFVILAFLCLHMYQFWAKMQLQELIHGHASICVGDSCVAGLPEFGTLFLYEAFGPCNAVCWATVVYCIGFVALWFHMTHGFWSMFHSVGWDNNIWLGRLKAIGCWWTTIVVALFVAEAVVFTVQAKNDYYINNEALQEQYAEVYGEKGMDIIKEASAQLMAAQNQEGVDMQALYDNVSRELLVKLEPIASAAERLCPNANSQELSQVVAIYGQLKAQYPTQDNLQN